MNYANISEVNLDDFFKPSKFRTIPSRKFDLPGAANELKVSIEINKDSYIRGMDIFPKCFWLETKICGYVRENDVLLSIIKEPKEKKKVEIKLCEFSNEKFTFSFEQADGTEEPLYFVKSEDIVKLFSGCLNPNM